jgi:hypothetical protein
MSSRTSFRSPVVIALFGFSPVQSRISMQKIMPQYAWISTPL